MMGGIFVLTINGAATSWNHQIQNYVDAGLSNDEGEKRRRVQ